MENKDHPFITRFAEGFESLTEHDIIERNKDLLLECQIETKDLSQITTSLYDFAFSREDEGIPSKKRLAVYCVWLILKIIETRRNLEDPAQDFVENIYHLASLREQYIAASYDREWFEDEGDAWSKLKGRLDKRTGLEDTKKKCALAVEHAEGLWKNGDPRNLPQMMCYLREEYERLPYKTLHDMLKPVAEKYGRLYDPHEGRGKRPVLENKPNMPIEQGEDADPHKESFFTINHYCQNCEHSEPMLKVLVGTPVQETQVKKPILCPKCKKLCSYLTEWHDDNPTMEPTYNQSIESVRAYNKEYVTPKS